MSPKVTYPDGSTPRICIIGAGFSGLCAGIQLRKQLGLDSFTIFESNNDVGGTWLTNTYPGCACDIPSHLYGFSFEPNPNWSKHFSQQPEIWEYLKNVAKKYDLYPKIQFNTKVKSIIWDKTYKKWRVSIVKNYNEEIEIEFDIVINGPGALRVPNYPEQFNAFKGTKIHSAEWNSDISLKNKVVGLIGSGASAIQIVPSIAPIVKELVVFQRQAPYVRHRIQFDYPQWTKSLFTIFPLLLWIFRALLYIRHDLTVWAFTAGHFINRIAQHISLVFMRKTIKDEKLRKSMVPKYKFGCKRVLVCENYYDAYNLSHVKLNTNKITKVNDFSITTADGNTKSLDVLILCTGFKVQDFFAPMEMIGKDGNNVVDTWKKDRPSSYFGIVSNVIPNHFVLLGPNTALGHNTVVFMIECQTNFAIKVIQEMMHRNASTVEIKASAEAKFMDDIYNELKTTIWGTEKCGSWYANERGQITALWPESCTNYWIKTRNPDFTKFDFS